MAGLVTQPPIFPMLHFGGHFADVDLRVEIGGKGVAMVAAIAIQNVDQANARQVVLAHIGRENAGYTGVEPPRPKVAISPAATN